MSLLSKRWPMVMPKQWLHNYRKMSNRIFVTDWDETATVKDTTGLIAGAASRADRGSVPPFSHFSEIYLEAYSTYVAKCVDSCGKRDTLDAEEEFQKGMRSVELSSISALEQAGYFKGFPMETFRSLVPQVDLQPGFINFIRRVECPVYVLSVNWCRSLIESVLRSHGVENVTVLANDLETDENSITTGNFDAAFDIRTGYDKVVELGKLRALYPQSELFYFGDSSGDVFPILKADYGGVITGGKGRKVLDRLAGVYSLQDNNFVSSNSHDLKVFQATWHDLDAAWFK
ncbi:hypothetical protein JCM33374_g5498 [Metschnikowia sp. JCM 33374]|nr:hypothetical protein JCM33374_g5498 [Metschnikowia sp. JCM 33374]